MVVLPINFDDVAKALERMKGQSERQDQRESGRGIMTAHPGKELSQCLIEEIEVFENKQNEDGAAYTEDKISLSGKTFSFFDLNS